MANNKKKNNGYDKTSDPKKGRGKGGNSATRGTKGKGDYSGSRSAYNDYVGKENDPRWYTHNQRLIADVTKIPFNAQVGFPIEVGFNEDFVVPAICKLELLLGPGVAKSNADGVNIAGQALFQKMRKDLSTYAPYAQADVTMFVLAMTDLFVRYAHVARFFGVANLYSYANLTYSDTLLQSMGLDTEGIVDFRQNFNDYRGEFNNLIYKMQSLYLPAAFPIIERYLWLFSNYFYDHNDPRAQLYVMKPANFWQLDETGESGTALHPEATAEYTNIPQYLEALNMAIEGIRNSDSMLKIMADMRNAFKDVAPWKFSFIDETYVIMPTYSTEVLSQIENAIILPAPQASLEAQSWSVSQDVNKNIITWEPLYLPDDLDIAAASDDDRLLQYGRFYDHNFINMHWTNPTSDDIVVATRLMPMLTLHDGGGALLLSAMGSDAVVNLTIYTYNAVRGSVDTDSIPYVYAVKPEWADVSTTKGYISMESFTRYLAFDWAPRTLMVDYTTSAQGALVQRASDALPVVEIDNYTSVTKSLMTKIHNNVIMSMWNVPELGTTYN